MTLPPPVEAVCASFLEAVPEGLVTGLFLRGGLAFGEWIEGQSDVDFVATLASRPSGDEISVLRAAHERVRSMHPDLPFDGMHVLAEDLAADPRTAPDGPTVLGGVFEAEGALDAVVAWHELARGGVVVLGSLPAIWSDAGVLRDFTCDNLDTYWRRTAEALADFPDEGRTERACVWCVLGVARLHHLLVTGDMTTKSRAGAWGLGFYDDRWHPVLREALRIRSGSDAESLVDDESRAADVAAFTAYVVAAGTT